MYYLYKKDKKTELPSFTYTFKGFDEFYEIASLLREPFVGHYYIRVKTDSYEEVMSFLKVESSYPLLTVYVEVSEPLLDYILLRRPEAKVLSSKSNYDVFKELVSRYNILFDKGCLDVMYRAIGHSYTEMAEALELVLNAYPDEVMIKREHLSKLFILENIVYPRMVCVSYLKMDRWRKSKLKKCLEYFGNDLVLYSMRKTVRQLLKDKTLYYKTGKGSPTVKSVPMENLVKLSYALDFNRGNFKDVLTILNLYEKGEYVYDTLQKRSLSSSDEEYHAS